MVEETKGSMHLDTMKPILYLTRHFWDESREKQGYQ